MSKAKALNAPVPIYPFHPRGTTDLEIPVRHERGRGKLEVRSKRLGKAENLNCKSLGESAERSEHATHSISDGVLKANTAEII